jgi:hypothetical protein
MLAEWSPKTCSPRCMQDQWPPATPTTTRPITRLMKLGIRRRNSYNPRSESNTPLSTRCSWRVTIMIMFCRTSKRFIQKRTNAWKPVIMVGHGRKWISSKVSAHQSLPCKINGLSVPRFAISARWCPKVSITCLRRIRCVWVTTVSWTPPLLTK